MKISDLITSLFKGKTKVPRKSTDLKFPVLTHREFVLLRAERNTGIVLDVNFKYALNNKATVYTKFSNFCDAVDAATEIVKTSPDVEVGIYDKNRQVVYLLDLEKEEFCRPDLEFELKFKKQINQASEETLVKFGLDICKRLLPEYINFYNRQQWGDPSALKIAINYCESYKWADMQNQILQDHWDRVSDVTPDAEDYGDYDGSYALNAGCAVMALLSFVIDSNNDFITEISTYMTDTIDFKLHEANPNLTDKEIETHYEMIQEWKYQLDFISNKSKF